MEVVNQLLKEEETVADLVEFTNSNFTVSLFPMEKRVVFSPIDHLSLTEEIRRIIGELKDNFRIISIKQEGQGSFELVFDPRENFDNITGHLRSHGI